MPVNRRAVSIRDIAQAAGVSHATVSRALHQSPLISVEMRARIQQLAREMGYTPNAIAQSLKCRQTQCIGLVVTSIADPFFGPIVRGIDEVAQQSRISVLLSVGNNDPERELQAIETFHRRRVDGVISAAARISGPRVEHLADLGIPTVWINRQADSSPGLLHSVEVDDCRGARQAVSHLIELGHEMIGYLGTGSRPRSNRRRLDGYRQALLSAGREAPDCWVRVAPRELGHHSNDVAAGRSLLPGLLDEGVTAVFCYNDMMAVGALMACRDLGIAVPANLSLVGFDDIDLAQYVDPPLTTVHQPKVSLGRAAMEMLLDIIEGRPVENQVLETTLVRRSSAASTRKSCDP